MRNLKEVFWSRGVQTPGEVYIHRRKTRALAGTPNEVYLHGWRKTRVHAGTPGEVYVHRRETRVQAGTNDDGYTYRRTARTQAGTLGEVYIHWRKTRAAQANTAIAGLCSREREIKGVELVGKTEELLLLHAGDSPGHQIVQ